MLLRHRKEYQHASTPSIKFAHFFMTSCTKQVYPHLLRHSVATTLLERGMPIEQIQKFLGHSKLETTQIYAESSAEMIKESYQRALGG